MTRSRFPHSNDPSFIGAGGIAAAALCLVVTQLAGVLAGLTAGFGWLASPLIVSNAIAAGGTLSATIVVATPLVA